MSNISAELLSFIIWIYKKKDSFPYRIVNNIATIYAVRFAKKENFSLVFAVESTKWMSTAAGLTTQTCSGIARSTVGPLSVKGNKWRAVVRPPSPLLSRPPAMRETKEALENASVGLEVLKEGTGKLIFNLSLVRTSIQRTLNDPGCHDEQSDATSAQLCRSIRQSLSQLHISANFTRVRRFIHLQCLHTPAGCSLLLWHQTIKGF